RGQAIWEDTMRVMRDGRFLTCPPDGWTGEALMHIDMTIPEPHPIAWYLNVDAFAFDPFRRVHRISEMGHTGGRSAYHHIQFDKPNEIRMLAIFPSSRRPVSRWDVGNMGLVVTVWMVGERRPSSFRTLRLVETAQLRHYNRGILRGLIRNMEGSVSFLARISANEMESLGSDEGTGGGGGGDDGDDDGDDDDGDDDDG